MLVEVFDRSSQQPIKTVPVLCERDGLIVLQHVGNNERYSHHNYARLVDDAGAVLAVLHIFSGGATSIVSAGGKPTT